VLVDSAQIKPMKPIITLLTDFGIADGYVAGMKGVILNICMDVHLVDISHSIPPQDIRSAAYLISTVFQYFPSGAVHLAVVDPGVGTERRGLAIQAAGHYFVGPDNGLFSWALQGQPQWQAHSLENPAYWRSAVSKTFHGRDIFAPVAAHLASGTPLAAFGPPCNPCLASWASLTRSPQEIRGEVIHIDHFGNIITSLRLQDVEDFTAGGVWRVAIGLHHITRFANTYGEVAPGSALMLIGSSGFLEIALNQGSAAKMMKVKTGDRVCLQHLKEVP
jgi:S-adenosyl-L-methionine hydrolase (adenosine-forming)